MLNAFTVDVEEHFQVSAFEGVVDRSEWGSIPSRVEANTSRLIDLLAEFGVSATFFVLGWVAEKRPDLVKRIAAAGHEIGSHGYSHRLIYEQSPQEFSRELTRSRALLQEASGQPVEGHRAASFSIGRGNLWALDILGEAGFRYDSSLFPIVHDRYGFPGAPRRPYRLRTACGRELIEIPPSTVRVGRWTIPAAGGGYLRLYPEWTTRWAIRRLNRVERIPAVVYIHPWEVDPEQPRVNGLPLRSRLRHYVGLRTTAGKIRGILRHHDFGTMGDVVSRLEAVDEFRFE